LVKTVNISEVSPPAVLQELRETLEQYQPQVEILSPKAEAVLEDNSVAVQFQVADLPLFKDAKLGLGPHLHVLIDNQTYQAVYDVSQPVVFSDLTPGTHTIRAFASRPWHESFKNEGAYAQVTFHVFTKTQENNPDPRQPLLTYSRPQGTYGAEPILLDFYLANAPLHLIAQADDEVDDWRIRCTVNGTSFIVDRWQPLYLQGFKPGKNWVQLELLDEQGQPIKNAFNTTTRIVDYQPGGKDTLSKLVRGELKAAEVKGIVTAGAQPTAPPKPSPSPTPKASPTPTEIPAAEQPVKKLPVVPIVPLPEKLSPALPAAPKGIAPPAPKKEKPGGLLSRFRKEAKESPSPEPTVIAPKATKTVPQPEKSLAPEPGDRPQPTATLTPAPKLAPSPKPELVAPPKVAPKAIEPKVTPVPDLAPAPKPTKFEAKPTPKPSPTITPQPLKVKTPDLKPSPDLVKPLPLKSVPEAESTKPAIIPPAQPHPPSQAGKLKGFLDRFRKPEAEPSLVTPKSTPAVTEPQATPAPEVKPKLDPANKFAPKPIPESSPKLMPKPAVVQTPKPAPTATKLEPKPIAKPALEVAPQITPKPVVVEPLQPQPLPKVEKSVPAKTEPAVIAPVKPPAAVAPPLKPDPAPVEKLKGFFDRWRKPEAESPPSATPKVPSTPVMAEPKATPSPQVAPKPAPSVSKFEPKSTPKPTVVETPKLQPTPKAESLPSEPKIIQLPPPASQPEKPPGFLERLRQRSSDQNQDKKPLQDYLNRNRPTPRTPDNLALPSVLPAMEAPAKPPVVKLPVMPFQPQLVPTVKSPTVKVPMVPKPAITSGQSETIAPKAQTVPEGLKVFSAPPQPSPKLKIIRPEETPTVPSRYLKKPDPGQADQ
jgi:hypothetical protein